MEPSGISTKIGIDPAQRLTLIRQAAKRNVPVGARWGERLGLSTKDDWS